MTSVNYVAATGAQDFQWNISFSLTTSQTAGTVVQGNIQAFGSQAPSSALVTVPITEVWQITDMYVVGSPVAADGLLNIYVNGYLQNIQPSLSSMNLNILTRFRMSMSMPLGPSFSWFVNLVLLAEPSAAATQTVIFKGTKSPYTG